MSSKNDLGSLSPAALHVPKPQTNVNIARKVQVQLQSWWMPYKYWEYFVVLYCDVVKSETPKLSLFDSENSNVREIKNIKKHKRFRRMNLK